MTYTVMVGALNSAQSNPIPDVCFSQKLAEFCDIWQSYDKHKTGDVFSETYCRYSVKLQ